MATNVTTTGYSLGRLAELARERVGDSSLLVFEDQSFTGSQLDDRASRLSAGLRAAGLRPGDRVVVCMANCPEVGITYTATWRAGAVVTPVLFLLSEPELRHVLSDSGARFVVTTPEFLAKVLAAATGVDTVHAVVLAGPAPQAPPAPVNGTGAVPPVLDFADLESGDPSDLVDTPSSELAALLYTGGTTGRAKGVMLTHDAMVAAGFSWHLGQRDDAVAEGERPVGLSPLPLSHVYGLMVSVMALHATEPGTSVLMRWFDSVDWLTLVAEHRVQTAALVPMMVQALLAVRLENHDLSTLRRVASGSAPLPQAVAEEWARRVPHAVLLEGYGCTESSAVITTSPARAPRPGSVGLPSPGVQVRVERPDGSEAGVDEPGEICVRGPMLMSGYWNSPEDTARALRGGWLHTGDIGRRDADGYFYVVDRIKDVIIRNGFNVYPRDVEDAMATHPQVAACGVVGRPDPIHGEEVVAFVQLVPGATVTARDLVTYGKARLSAVKYPRDIRIVDALPLTSVLKTDRKALRGLVTP